MPQNCKNEQTARKRYAAAGNWIFFAAAFSNITKGKNCDLDMTPKHDTYRCFLVRRGALFQTSSFHSYMKKKQT